MLDDRLSETLDDVVSENALLGAFGYENLALLINGIASRISILEIGSFTLRTSKGEVFGSFSGRIIKIRPSRLLNFTCPSIDALSSKVESRSLARNKNK